MECCHNFRSCFYSVLSILYLTCVILVGMQFFCECEKGNKIYQFPYFSSRLREMSTLHDMCYTYIQERTNRLFYGQRINLIHRTNRNEYNTSTYPKYKQWMEIKDLMYKWQTRCELEHWNKKRGRNAVTFIVCRKWLFVCLTSFYYRHDFCILFEVISSVNQVHCFLSFIKLLDFKLLLYLLGSGEFQTTSLPKTLWSICILICTSNFRIFFGS